MSRDILTPHLIPVTLCRNNLIPLLLGPNKYTLLMWIKITIAPTHKMSIIIIIIIKIIHRSILLWSVIRHLGLSMKTIISEDLRFLHTLCQPQIIIFSIVLNNPKCSKLHTRTLIIQRIFIPTSKCSSRRRIKILLLTRVRHRILKWTHLLSNKCNKNRRLFRWLAILSVCLIFSQAIIIKIYLADRKQCLMAPVMIIWVIIWEQIIKIVGEKIIWMHR